MARYPFPVIYDKPLYIMAKLGGRDRLPRRHVFGRGTAILALNRGTKIVSGNRVHILRNRVAIIYNPHGSTWGY